MRVKKYLYIAGVALALCVVLRQGSVTAQAKSKYTIYVNRKTNIVNVVNQKSSKLVRSMYCSTGKNYRTIKGTYYTKAKYRWRALYGGVYGQYATRISGAYLFHSVPYTRRSVKSVITKDYNRLGKQDSLGCVRLAVADCKWIYDHCSIGTKVVINDTRKMVKPTRPLLKISTKSKTGWDPTDPNSGNPYRPVIKKVFKGTIKAGSTFDEKTAISVSSSFTEEDELLDNTRVTGKVDTSSPGTYKVTYSVTDPNTLLTKKATYTYTVVK